jgi:hypothetical protein
MMMFAVVPPQTEPTIPPTSFATANPFITILLSREYLLIIGYVLHAKKKKEKRS